MKKKGIAVVVGIAMMAGMTACGGNPRSDQVQPVTEATKETETVQESDGVQESETVQTSQEVQTPKTTESAERISEEEAKKIALSDAGVEENDVTQMRVTLGVDDGVEEYEVDFYVGNQEYDYDIEAATGTIRSKDMDIDDDFATATPTGDTISEADARGIALERVQGAGDTDIHMKLDEDNGKQVYEGEIIYKDREYEFEMDAVTGEILEWSEESVWDD